MSGFELYFFISGLIFHGVLAVLIFMFVVYPLGSYLACSFSFHNFYAKGIGRKFGWWAWKSTFKNWLEYGGGGITVRPKFGEWRGFGDYTFYKDSPVSEDEAEPEEDEDTYFDESFRECYRRPAEPVDRTHLKAPKRKPRPNIPPLKGKSK